MKNRFQIIPVLATLCAGGWFAFWLFAFQPMPTFSNSPSLPSLVATRLNEKACLLRKVLNPTHFALPSINGFSGPFPETCVVLRLALEKPVQETWFLPPENTKKTAMDLDWLLPNTASLQRALPIPNVMPDAPKLPVGNRPQLTFSPNLASRVENETMPSGLANENLPSYVRIHLTIRSEGTVRHALFETPTTHQTLLGSIRQLQFKPTKIQTTGWVDFCSTKESVSSCP